MCCKRLEFEVVMSKETKYKMPDWAVDQIVRADGRVEDICEHGVGHPNLEYLMSIDDSNKRYYASIHGCDGCCWKGNKQ